MIKSNDWDRVKQLFNDSLELELPDRADFLADRCGPDQNLRAEIEALLASHREARGFLQTPAELDTNSMSDAVAAALVGQSLGGYTIRRVIGRGSMGIVYLAEQDCPPRTVALKVVSPGLTSARMLRRFEHETQILSRLRHPGIAQIYEGGTADTDHGKQPYFAMEFVDGLALMNYAEHHDLNTPQRLGLLAKVCDAVQHAHMNSVIHRDLKPANVLVDRSGQPKVLDFGIARMTDSDVQATTIRTQVGHLLGTIPYMSPEQITGDPANVDTRSDIYALGVIGYELLAARLPHDLHSRTVPEALRVMTEEDITPLSVIDRAFRGDLDTIFGKALARDKAERYQTALDFSNDIRRYLQSEPILARPPSTGYQLRKMLLRHKLPFAFATVLFVVLAGSALSLWTQSREVGRQRDKAVLAERLAEERLLGMTDAHRQRDREARKAEEINRFLQGMLASADPTREGRHVTVLEVVDQAAARVDHELEGLPDVEAAVRSTLGTTYQSLSKYEQAEEQFREVVALYKLRPGPQRLEAADVMDKLAAILSAKANFEEAEKFYRDALAIRREVLGDEHPQLTTSLNEMATFFHNRGDRKAAEPVVQEALRLYHEILDQGQALIDVDLSGLAAYLCMQEKYDEALALYRDTLDMRRRLLGNEHLLVAYDLIGLAGLIGSGSENAEAEAYAREALRILRRHLGDKHVDVAETLTYLAGYLRAGGDTAGAEKLLRESLAMRRELLGDVHETVVEGLMRLTSLLKIQGTIDDIAPLYREALATSLELLGEDHPTVAYVRSQFGRSLFYAGRYVEAEELLRSSMTHHHKTLPEGHWRLAYVQSDLGACLTALGRYAEAESLLSDGYAAIKTKRGPQHKKTIETLERIAALYTAWNKLDQAAGYRAILNQSTADKSP